jgi:hypothetical protein
MSPTDKIIFVCGFALGEMKAIVSLVGSKYTEKQAIDEFRKVLSKLDAKLTDIENEYAQELRDDAT